MGAPVQGWANADTIEDVIERMALIDSAHPAEDGVATFNRMYAQVTRLVRDAVANDRFRSGEFLERLDVQFGNLYFQAYADDLDGHPVSPAWAPLFEARSKPNTYPVQFALAGMNAHISHDLPMAVIATCHELGISPEDDSPQHLDYTTTNDVLDQATNEIKSWFSTGVVATLDALGGKVDDGFAMFSIHLARAAAWESGQILWGLSQHERLADLFRNGLSHSVSLTSRGILL